MAAQVTRFVMLLLLLVTTLCVGLLEAGGAAWGGLQRLRKLQARQAAAGAAAERCALGSVVNKLLLTSMPCCLSSLHLLECITLLAAKTNFPNQNYPGGGTLSNNKCAAPMPPLSSAFNLPFSP
jgi:hypothetical protein